jgi:hypothetical protein
LGKISQAHQLALVGLIAKLLVELGAACSDYLDKHLVMFGHMGGD